MLPRARSAGSGELSGAERLTEGVLDPASPAHGSSLPQSTPNNHRHPGRPEGASRGPEGKGRAIAAANIPPVATGSLCIADIVGFCPDGGGRGSLGPWSFEAESRLGAVDT